MACYQAAQGAEGKGVGKTEVGRGQGHRANHHSRQGAEPGGSMGAGAGVGWWGCIWNEKAKPTLILVGLGVGWSRFVGWFHY